MTIVCPKCMHKAGDDERVCAKCGALLLSAAQRRDVVRAPDDSAAAKSGGSRPKTGPGDSSPSLSVGPTQIAAGREKIATNGDSAEAIREALEYLESGADRKATYQSKYVPKGAKPERRINQKWLATIVITVLAVIAVSLFFGLKSSPSSNTGSKGAGNTPVTSATLLFQYSGSGTSTTGSFVTSAPFMFSYRLSCQSPLTVPSTFVLLKDRTKVDVVSSNVGAAVEKGTQSNFGAGGAYTISVDAPPTCTWTILGLT